ncbi:hypothetical protein B0H16DRAFT_1485750 [Mycena metata]|uniref:Uncharacterized protein n=1 Tax=Mycena metata TaxID=1033252 RepID=A0AAD7DP95_9AGAR|nr:hypothetical protein B0H16DRAFT_1485750 [Mycena metata]
MLESVSPRTDGDSRSAFGASLEVTVSNDRRAHTPDMYNGNDEGETAVAMACSNIKARRSWKVRSRRIKAWQAVTTPSTCARAQAVDNSRTICFPGLVCKSVARGLGRRQSTKCLQIHGLSESGARHTEAHGVTADTADDEALLNIQSAITILPVYIPPTSLRWMSVLPAARFLKVAYDTESYYAISFPSLVTVLHGAGRPAKYQVHRQKQPSPRPRRLLAPAAIFNTSRGLAVTVAKIAKDLPPLS